MNAHAKPTAVRSPLTLAALNNAAVLRALRDHGPLATHLEVAEKADQPSKNMKRALETLHADSLVEFLVKGGWSITDLGRRALAAIDVAEGRLAVDAVEAPSGSATSHDPDVLLLEHHQLKRNPLQPRKLDLTKPDERREMDELKASIKADLDRGGTGVLMPLLVYPVDEDGSHTINAGERRWTAVGELIDEQAWPLGLRLRAVVRKHTTGQTAFTALIENGRRSSLKLIEEARAYAELIADTGWSARQAALSTGRDVRSVQEMQKVLREAAPEDIARHEADPAAYTWEQLRDSVKSHRDEEPAGDAQNDLEDAVGASADMPLDQQMLLVELAFKTTNYPIHHDEGGSWADVSGYGYLNAPWRALRDGGLLEAAMPTLFGRPCCVGRPTEAGYAWLLENYPHGFTDFEALLAFRERIGRQEREPPAGLDEGWYAEVLNDRIGAHNVKLARDTWTTPTGRDLRVAAELARKQAVAPLKGKSFKGGVEGAHINDRADEDLSPLTWAGLANREHISSRNVVSLTADGRRWLADRLGGDPATDDAALASAYLAAGTEEPAPGRYLTAWLNDDYPRDDPYKRDKSDGTGGAGQKTSTKAPAGPDTVLPTVDRLALIELAHKVQVQGRDGWVYVEGYWLHDPATNLQGQGLIECRHNVDPHGPCARVTPAGEAWLDANVGAITPSVMFEAARDAGADLELGDLYATTWLNVTALNTAPASTLVQGAGDEPLHFDGEGGLSEERATAQDLDDEADENLLDHLVEKLRERFDATVDRDDRWSRLTVTDLASNAVAAMTRGDVVATLEALAGVLHRARSDRANTILRDVVFGSGLDFTPERDTSDDDPLLFALRSGDLVSVGGSASAYRLLTVSERFGGAHPVEGRSFEAQQVSLKTGRDVGKPRHVTLHAIQGMVPASAVPKSKAAD